MQFPAFTGQAARFVGATEPQLNGLVRKNKIVPPPEVVGGRRLWAREQIRQAAAHLGLLTDDLRRHLDEEVSNAS